MQAPSDEEWWVAGIDQLIEGAQWPISRSYQLMLPQSHMLKILLSNMAELRETIFLLIPPNES